MGLLWNGVAEDAVFDQNLIYELFYTLLHKVRVMQANTGDGQTVSTLQLFNIHV